MATLTIRDLDETLKHRLRVRAAHRNHSMEEEVRQILDAALRDTPMLPADLAQRIRGRFAGLGDVQLPIPEREPVRTPPTFDEPTSRRGTGRATPRPTGRARPR